MQLKTEMNYKIMYEPECYKTPLDWGKKTKQFKKWLLMQSENSPDLEPKSQSSCGSLGLGPGAEGALSSPWEAGTAQHIGIAF